jgi:ribosomal protein S18 acetylase RimI-like enzyme
VAPTTIDRVLAFALATAEACADEARDAGFGRVLSTPSLPLVWSLNGVWVSKPADDPFEALPDAPRPSVYFCDAALGERFDLDAWDTESELYMVLRDAPGPPERGAVRGAQRDEIEALAREWIVEEFASQGSEAVEQLLDYIRRRWDARPTRAFVSPDASAMAKLWSDGTVAQVEDVYTRPDGRGRGHARALVSHLADLAVSEGHEVVFIVADDEDTPKELYARLGFEPVRLARRYVRPAAAQAS